MDKENTYVRVRLPFIIESVALAVIPFEEVLTLPIGSVLRLMNFLTIICCIIESRTIKIKKDKNLPLYPMIFFILYAMISFFWCYNRTYYLDRLSTYGLYGVLIVLLSSLVPSVKEKLIMLNGLLLGGIAASVMIVFSGSSLNIGGRDTLVIMGRMVDPNILSYSCVISLTICMYRVIVEKKCMLFHLVTSGLLFGAIIMCGSRGAMVTCFVVFALIIMNLDTKKNKFVKIILIFGVVFAIMLYVYFRFVLTSEFGTRYTFDNLIGKGSMGTANRDKIWRAAFCQILKRPIFGYGNGSSMYAIEDVYRFYGTHNSYLLVLLEFGIIGFVIVCLWQIKEYRKCCQNHCQIYKIIFLSLLCFVLFVEGFATKVFWGLQVLLMTACYGENVKKSF